MRGLLTRFDRWLRGERAARYTGAPPATPVSGTVRSNGEARIADAAAGDVAIDANTARAESIVPRLVAEPWYVDRVTVDGDHVAATGWSMPLPGATRPAQGWFTINERSFDETHYPLSRADVGDVFWQREGAAQSGFECSIGAMPDVYPNGVLEIRRIVPDTPAVEQGRDSWFAPDPALHADLPDDARRFRVIGDRDPLGFLVSGATDYHRLDRAALAVAGAHLADIPRVLDWGIGCGRVARHFPDAAARRLTGCDIDAENVGWCSAHLPGTFVVSPLSPPLPFADASFDFVYGISVFTHLREPMQLRWLEELARVSARGATLMMTTHGQTAIDFSRLSPVAYRKVIGDVQRAGLLVSGVNTQLDGHADHGGEYVNVYHSADYVRRTWGRFFSVEHILPGYILHHDLVILRRT